MSVTGGEDDRDTRRDVGLALGGLLPVIVAAMLVAVRGTLQNANVVLVLVVVVVFCGAIGGRAPGVVAACTSAVSFNFFHTQPYLRLTIDSANDVETTVLLLVVGLAVGHLAAGVRDARAFATTEIRRIHRMAQFTSRGEDPTVVILAAEVELRDLLGLKGCRFEAPASLLAYPRLDESGRLDVHEHRFTREGFELPTAGVELPVYARGHQVGRFVLEPSPGVGISRERRVIAVAVADQVGAALSGSAPGRTE